MQPLGAASRPKASEFNRVRVREGEQDEQGEQDGGMNDVSIFPYGSRRGYPVVEDSATLT